MIYSIWEGQGITLIPGEGPPCFEDGRLMDETAVKVTRFEAESWEHACQKMHERYGFEPYITGTIERKDMAHQFNIGDIVRLNGNAREAEVIGFKESTGSEGPLLHVMLAGTKMYFPVRAVTLVRSGGAAQAEHPSKLET